MKHQLRRTFFYFGTSLGNRRMTFYIHFHNYLWLPGHEVAWYLRALGGSQKFAGGMMGMPSQRSFLVARRNEVDQPVWRQLKSVFLCAKDFVTAAQSCLSKSLAPYTWQDRPTMFPHGCRRSGLETEEAHLSTVYLLDTFGTFTVHIRETLEHEWQFCLKENMSMKHCDIVKTCLPRI